MFKDKHKKKTIRLKDLAIKSALLVVLATLSKMNCRGINKKRRKMQLSGFSIKVRISFKTMFTKI